MYHLTAVIPLFVSGAMLFGQTSVQRPPADAAARFEVASIKRNMSGSGGMSVGGPPGRWVAVNATPLTLVMNAYPHEMFRILGAPGWMSSERYDVNAIAGGEANRERVQAMLRTLLAERFNFVAHTEVRPMQTYALVRARDDGQLGPRMKPWTIDCEALRKAGRLPPTPRTVEELMTPRPCSMSGGRGLYTAGGRPVDDLVRSLASELDGPVTDRTGLSGLFEMALRWNPDQSAPAADPSLPSLFTAVEEQLGLKLEARREPAEVLVIDRVDRPTPD